MTVIELLTDTEISSEANDLLEQSTPAEPLDAEQYIESLKASLQFHLGRWQRAHECLENVLGSMLYSQYLAGEAITRGQVAEALYDQIKALDEENGAFTVQLDVDDASAPRRKDGQMLKVKLSSPYTADHEAAIVQLMKLGSLGGTQVTFRPAYVRQPMWVQPRLTPVESNGYAESVASSDTAADNAIPKEPADESEPATPDPGEKRDEPTQIGPRTGRPPRGERGAQPIANQPETRGE